jgi:AP-3 complex subunit delta
LQQKAERLARLRDDPYYIGGGGSKASTPNVEDIPVVRLDDMPPLAAPGEYLTSLFPSTFSG